MSFFAILCMWEYFTALQKTKEEKQMLAWFNLELTPQPLVFVILRECQSY